MQAAAEPTSPAAPVTVIPAPLLVLESAGGGDDDAPVDPPSAPAGAFACGGVGGAAAGADGVGDELGGADGGDDAAGAELGGGVGVEAEAGGGDEVGLGALGAGAGGVAVAGGGLEADGAGEVAGDEPPEAFPLRPARTMTISFSLARQLASTPLIKKKAPAWSSVNTVFPSANFLSYDDVLQAL